MEQQHRRPTAKRSACDRCREHKLRCLRAQSQTQEPCVRCARAGASCVTGAPRPLGRPVVSTSENHQRQAPRRSRHSIFVPAKVPSYPAKAPGVSSQRPEPETANEPAAEQTLVAAGDGDFNGPHLTDSELSSMLFEEEVSSGESPDDMLYGLDYSTPANTVDLSSFGGAFNPAALTTMELGLDEWHGSAQPLLKSLAALPGPNTLGFAFSPGFQTQPIPVDVLEIPTRLTEPSLGPSSVLARLARLNEGIAVQLAFKDNFLQNMTALQPPLADECVEQVGNAKVNPMIRALESTSELAAIVNQIISPIQNRESSPLSTPAVLMCLSGYLQILKLYDAMFLRVHHILSGMQDIVGFFDNLPCFPHLVGLPPIKGDLYIKIAIQVVQHHLGAVERVMGLPADLCVQARRIPPKSLFSYVGSPQAFQSIMDQVCSPAEKSGRALVASLRASMDRVVGLLNDSG